MHFGQFKSILYIVFVILCFEACKTSESINLRFQSPDPGQLVISGKPIQLQVSLPNDFKGNIRYLLDGKELSSSNLRQPFIVDSKPLKLGFRLFSAIVESEKSIDTALVNVVILSDEKPKSLRYEIVETYPHDTSDYTQGLNFVDGKILESTGILGSSKLKWVNLKTGQSIQQSLLPSEYFGEGCVLVDGKIVMLTWQNEKGLVYDARTLQLLGSFPYKQSKEGWGLTFNGAHLLKSDGTNKIWRLDRKTYEEIDYIEVYDDQGVVNQLNELEWVEGKLFANVYGTSKIVVINPSTGKVEASLDLKALVPPKNYFKTDEDRSGNVLNGIAWDSLKKRLFVGGKKWPKLYQISISQ